MSKAATATERLIQMFNRRKLAQAYFNTLIDAIVSGDKMHQSQALWALASETGLNYSAEQVEKIAPHEEVKHLLLNLNEINER